MSASPTSEPKPGFVCDCDEEMRSACAGEPFYKKYESKQYCVLHFPGKEKSAEFEKAFHRKLKNKDFNFAGVWFPDPLSFPTFDFEGDVNFYRATFGAEADFSSVSFADYVNVRFSGDVMRPMFTNRSSPSLRSARFKEPDHVPFHAVNLGPHWFVDVSVRKLDFLDVWWRFKFDAEIDCLEKRGVSARYERLSKTFRDLAINSEENHRYQAASKFRYWAMDTVRRGSH